MANTPQVAAKLGLEESQIAGTLREAARSMGAAKVFTFLVKVTVVPPGIRAGAGRLDVRRLSPHHSFVVLATGHATTESGNEPGSYGRPVRRRRSRFQQAPDSSSDGIGGSRVAQPVDEKTEGGRERRVRPSPTCDVGLSFPDHVQLFPGLSAIDLCSREHAGNVPAASIRASLGDTRATPGSHIPCSAIVRRLPAGQGSESDLHKHHSSLLSVMSSAPSPEAGAYVRRIEVGRRRRQRLGRTRLVECSSNRFVSHVIKQMADETRSAPPRRDGAPLEHRPLEPTQAETC